jgi:hypothetical protein
MRTHHLLLAGLLASAVAGSAWAQGATPGIGATGGSQSPPSGLDSGLKGSYSFQGGGLATGGSALPALSPPPPSSAIGNGPPGPPGRPTAGTTAPQ